MKILFQGDSITDAFRKHQEPNPAYQLGNGYAFLVAAHLGAHHPERGWEFVNRGISGHGVRDLAARWQEDALNVEPDLLSLLTATNNTIQAMRNLSTLDDAGFLALYASLVDALIERKPKTHILLLEPFLLEVGDVTPVWKNHLLLRQQGIARFAHEKKLPFVPLQRIFDDACRNAPAAYWTYDGVHATHAGYQLIAEAWLQYAEPLLRIRERRVQEDSRFLASLV